MTVVAVRTMAWEESKGPRDTRDVTRIIRAYKGTWPYSFKYRIHITQLGRMQMS